MNTEDLEGEIVRLQVAVARALRERDEARQILKNIADISANAVRKIPHSKEESWSGDTLPKEEL